MDQVGHSIECPDCFTQSLVKAPKKVKKRVPNMETGPGYDLIPQQELVGSHALNERLLEEADREVKKTIAEKPKLPVRPFLNGVFLYPFYGRIFPVVLGTTLAWTGVAACAKVAWDLQAHRSLVAPFAFAGLGIILLFAIFPTLVSFQKMFENTSNGDEETDCRPEGGLLAFIDWVGDVMPMMVAIFISCAPGMLAMRTAHLQPEYYVAVAFSAYILFPMIHLSMLEAASVTGIVSKAVWGSIGKVPGTWFKFYFLSTLLFVFGGAAIVGLQRTISAGAEGNVAVASTIGALFVVLICITIYFRLMGRLAFILSQKIMVEVFEPNEPESNPNGAKNDAEIPLGV